MGTVSNKSYRAEIQKKYSIGDKVSASVEIKAIGTKFVTCISYMNGYSEFKTSLKDFFEDHCM